MATQDTNMVSAYTVPKAGDKAFYKEAELGIVVGIEVLDEKYARGVTHLITIKTPNGMPVIGKIKNVEFGKSTYNFKSF